VTALATVNRRLVLACRPTGMIDGAVVRLDEAAMPELRAGEALVAVRYLSIDPTIRVWMNDIPTYLPPIGVGDVVRSLGVGEVVASRNDRYPTGALVSGLTGWQDYAVAGEGAAAMRVLGSDVAARDALGVLGVTGMAAYFGMLEIGRVQPGDVVVVSGAAGAVGSVAGQIARIKGAGTIVGLAGTPEKCALLVDELGFDAAIDYRRDDVPAALAHACPDGIDLYFDNVGGELLDACLGQIALRGRVVVCGAISRYNETCPTPGPANYLNLLIRRCRMEGFLVRDYVDRFAGAQAEMAGWIADGSVRHADHVVSGLERAPEALNMLFTGDNRGKLLVRL
jgi:NADPH-dependent curcumin reductase CurA